MRATTPIVRRSSHLWTELGTTMIWFLFLRCEKFVTDTTLFHLQVAARNSNTVSEEK